MDIKNHENFDSLQDIVASTEYLDRNRSFESSVPSISSGIYSRSNTDRYCFKYLR